MSSQHTPRLLGCPHYIDSFHLVDPTDYRGSGLNGNTRQVAPMRVRAVSEDLVEASFERLFQFFVPGRAPVAYGMAAHRDDNANVSRKFHGMRIGSGILPMTDSWPSFRINNITRTALSSRRGLIRRHQPTWFGVVGGSTVVTPDRSKVGRLSTRHPSSNG